MTGRTIVPDPTLAHVQSFCDRIVPGGAAQLVEHAPLPGKPEKECFSIVPEQVAAKGGSQLTGWCIWQVPGILIEAEFHAVWQRPPDGRLIDITPRPVFLTQVLFLPDPKHQYMGRQIDNIRQPLVRDHDVTRYLFLLHRRFEMLNEGDLADQHGLVSLGGKALRDYERLVKDVAQLERRLRRRYTP